MAWHDEYKCVVGEGERKWYSPNGVPLAVFTDYFGGTSYHSLFDGIELRDDDFETEEDAVKYLIRQHDCLTTTKTERFVRSMSRVFKHGVWSAIAAAAAIIAALLGVLTYINTLPLSP